MGDFLLVWERLLGSFVMVKSWELDGEIEREGGGGWFRVLKGERLRIERILVVSMECLGFNINLWLFILYIIE